MINQSKVHRSRCTEPQKTRNPQEEVVSTLTELRIYLQEIQKKEVDPTTHPL